MVPGESCLLVAERLLLSAPCVLARLQSGALRCNLSLQLLRGGGVLSVLLSQATLADAQRVGGQHMFAVDARQPLL